MPELFGALFEDEIPAGIQQKIESGDDWIRDTVGIKGKVLLQIKKDLLAEPTRRKLTRKNRKTKGMV